VSGEKKGKGSVVWGTSERQKRKIVYRVECGGGSDENILAGAKNVLVLKEKLEGKGGKEHASKGRRKSSAGQRGGPGETGRTEVLHKSRRTRKTKAKRKTRLRAF